MAYLLAALLVLSMSAPAAEHLTRPHVINVDHHGPPYQPTFDSSGDGPLTFVWNTYKNDRDRLFSATIRSDQRSRTQQLSPGGGVYHAPKFVSTGPDSGWLVWQQQYGLHWRIVGRRLDHGFWHPLLAISEPARDGLIPAIVHHGGGLTVAWEDHSARPQTIAHRIWDGAKWGPIENATPGLSMPAYRPALAAMPSGEAWLLFDAYDGLNYGVYARSLADASTAPQRLSPQDKSCMSAVAAYGSKTGLVAAWVAEFDVIGKGILDQWHTAQAAAFRDGEWRLTRANGSADIADLTHSLLSRIEPEVGPIWGFAGRRLHPMLVEDSGEVWMLWERKLHHDGRSVEPGELNGRRFDGAAWSAPKRLHENRVRYEVPSSAGAVDGKLTVVAMDTTHNFEAFLLDLRGGEPYRPTELSGWKPQPLPLRDFGPRPSIELNGETHYLWWGDLHVHTTLTADAEGEVDELMHFARDKAKIDVVVMQENDNTSWLDSNNQGAYRGGAVTASEYALSVYFSRRYTEPGRFVALPGWEWSARTDDNQANHRTVIYAGDDAPIARHVEIDNNFADLCDIVEAAGGVMNSQHEVYRLVDRPCDANIEVAAGWGVYIDQPAKIHSDLSAGYKVGFVGTSDGHRRNPGTGGGLTGFWAPQLTSESMLRALKEHRVYATSGSRIVVDARANGVFMGSDVEAVADVKLEISVKTPRPLVKLVLLRDGDEIRVVDGKGSSEARETYVDRPGPGFHWYYWRVEQAGDAPDYPANVKVAEGQKAWSSPHRVRVK